MRIICSTCASHYEVEAEKIPAAGQLVRCTHCRDVWLVRSPEPAVAQTGALALAIGKSPAAEARRVAPQAPGPSASTHSVPAPIDFRAAKIRLRPRRDRLDTGHSVRGTIGTLALALFCLSVAAVTLATRSTLARHVPGVASLFETLGLPVAPRGLTLRDVKSALVAEGGKTVLTLQGEITNPRAESMAVPALTLVVRDRGQMPLYTWTAASPKARLAGGETVAFRSRLAAPPADGADVRVSFAGSTGL